MSLDLKGCKIQILLFKIVLSTLNVFQILPNSSDPTHFEAIELVNAIAAPRKISNGDTVKYNKILLNYS